MGHQASKGTRKKSKESEREIIKVSLSEINADDKAVSRSVSDMALSVTEAQITCIPICSRFESRKRLKTDGGQTIQLNKVP